jgi:6-phospho-3-hexuloisomerase
MSDITAAIVDELKSCLGRVSDDEVTRAVALIGDAPRVFCAGAGRSALGVRGFAMRLMHMGKPTFVVGETTTPGIGRGDLLVVGSGSGRTASLLSAATKAKGLGAKVLLITIDPQSPIGELADVAVRIPAPSPKAAGGGADVKTIQPMGSLFEQSLFLLLDAIVVMLMRRAGVTSEQMFKNHANME